MELPCSHIFIHTFMNIYEYIVSILYILETCVPICVIVISVGSSLSSL